MPVSRTEYSARLGQVVVTVNQAGVGVADAQYDVSICQTDEECADAMDSLAHEFKKYTPILNEEMGKMEAMQVPQDLRGLHDAYLRNLKLRVEAGELTVQGWESLDEVQLTRGMEKLQQAQVEYRDVLDELQALIGN